ncbi:hypothetical protein [Paraburkholderia graminis]|uniref:hypothetical protein n=1 Tax=Paraburkholderia graminis TaxID=60548 RepID=UPI0038B8818C
MQTIHPTREVLKAVLTGFSDPHGIAEVFGILYPGHTPDFVDVVGMGPHADELMVSHVRAFFNEAKNPDSRHHMFKSVTAHVGDYLTKFDVKPNGPDVFKFICGFAYELERFSSRLGERHLVTAMIRVNTVRMLRNAAEMKHPQHAQIPDVMLRKLFNVWKEDEQAQLLGRYGTYMLFKTWSLAEAAAASLTAEVCSADEAANTPDSTQAA